MAAFDKLKQASDKVAQAAQLAREAAAELLADPSVKSDIGRNVLNLHSALVQQGGEVMQRAKELTPASPLPATDQPK